MIVEAKVRTDKEKSRPSSPELKADMDSSSALSVQSTLSKAAQLLQPFSVEQPANLEPAVHNQPSAFSEQSKEAAPAARRGSLNSRPTLSSANSLSEPTETKLDPTFHPATVHEIAFHPHAPTAVDTMFDAPIPQSSIHSEVKRRGSAQAITGVPSKVSLMTSKFVEPLPIPEEEPVSKRYGVPANLPAPPAMLPSSTPLPENKEQPSFHSDQPNFDPVGRRQSVADMMQAQRERGSKLELLAPYPPVVELPPPIIEVPEPEPPKQEIVPEPARSPARSRWQVFVSPALQHL